MKHECRLAPFSANAIRIPISRKASLPQAQFREAQGECLTALECSTPSKPSARCSSSPTAHELGLGFSYQVRRGTRSVVAESQCRSLALVRFFAWVIEGVVARRMIAERNSARSRCTGSEAGWYPAVVRHELRMNIPRTAPSIAAMGGHCECRRGDGGIDRNP